MNKFIWYIKRLSCMSLAEISHRTYIFIGINASRFIRNNVDMEKVLDRNPIKTNFYFGPNSIGELRQEFINLFPGRLKEIVNEADLCCQHKFRVFDLDLDAGEHIDWHKDIVTGKRWPIKYWADIDFRNNHCSKDVRLVWELNRHQHLVTLGEAYLLTVQKKYAEEVKNQIFSWITDNPIHIGVNWASPLEISIRLVSWCWAYKFIESSCVFSEDNKAEFLKSIYMQVNFIDRNISKYSSANNHLIGEACGLLMTGLAFPEFKNSEEWVNKGKAILFEEILKQVHPDGVTKEQAFGYQVFVMELCLLAVILLVKNDIKVPEEVYERFYAMCEFIINIMDVNGKIPNIGDSDSGRAVRLSQDKKFNVVKSLLSSASILNGRGDFKEKGGVFEEVQYWLFGAKGFRRYKRINSVKPFLHSRLFKKGGYAVFRGSSDNGKASILTMDCGELGYTSIAAHGHADLLSITLSLDGVEFLIDPGTYLYHTGSAWRDYFRGTSSHNTITVNNKNQSEIKGPFMWGKRPVPTIEEWESSNNRDRISVSYNNCTVRHKRTIYFDKKKNVWLIEDFLKTKEKSTIRQYFHLSPFSTVKLFGTNILEIQNQGIFLYMILDKTFSVDIKEGEESPIAGWSSNMFGNKVNSPTVLNKALIEGSEKFYTLLYFSRKKLRLH
ncbi:MAG: heparinase II/III family protein [Candidatus Omnitrophica bacterium]|nr:heparinase II/III family protein [Candidatus Omnitrophota bacterium]